MEREEFDIEIDDEDINLDNLLNFNKLMKLIKNYIQSPLLE